MYIKKEWRGWVLVISIFFFTASRLWTQDGCWKEANWQKDAQRFDGSEQEHITHLHLDTHTHWHSEATQRFVEIKVTSMSRHTWGGEVKVKKLGQKRKRCSCSCSALLLFLPAVSLIHWILFLTAVANRNLRSDFFWLMLILLGLFGCLLIC